MNPNRRSTAVAEGEPLDALHVIPDGDDPDAHTASRSCACHFRGGLVGLGTGRLVVRHQHRRRDPRWRVTPTRW